MNKLKDLREDKDLTLKQLEKITNINYGVINQIELGKRQFNEDNLRILSDYFQCSTDYMLCRENPDLNKLQRLFENKQYNNLDSNDIDLIIRFIDMLDKRHL